MYILRIIFKQNDFRRVNIVDKSGTMEVIIGRYLLNIEHAGFQYIPLPLYSYKASH